MLAPDFFDLMLPALQVFEEGREHSPREIRVAVAVKLNLSDDVLAERLGHGDQGTYESALNYALFQLRRAGLTEQVRHGVHRITERGRQLLATKPEHFNVALLESSPEYREILKRFQARTGASPLAAQVTNDGERPVVLEPPESLLARVWEEHRRTVEDELLQRLLNISPRRFESLVIELLVAMGYGGSFADAAQRIGRTGDEGIDGVIKEDRLGLDAVYVQAKRWRDTVGRPEIQKFAGSMQGVRARKGVFITTSSFSREAREYADRIDVRLVLIDGNALARLLFEYEVGVKSESVYPVKRIDDEFFADD